MKKKILIVGTVPYNEQSTSRAFESYFSRIEEQYLAQIYSDSQVPPKGHCSTFFQITDKRLLEKRFNSKIETGKIYTNHYVNKQNLMNNNSNMLIKFLYKIGKNKFSLNYLLRKQLWKKKYWCSDLLIEWLESFKPNCVFLSFSDDFFIPQIALFVAKRYNIPIISSIGDDYYFNYNFSISPLYHVYKLTYRHLIRDIFSWPGSAIFIGNKIRDKYNSYFNLNGETVYLTSSIERRPFKKIDKYNLKISYFGNIRLGRNESLLDIGSVLGEINSSYILDIYSNENNSKYYKIFDKCENIHFSGTIPYQEVKKKTIESDIIIIVEGFKKKHTEITKYSLSTKVADSLSSGVNVFAYGSLNCGAIEYSQQTGSIVVCNKFNDLYDKLVELINDCALQKNNYDNAIKVVEKNHKLDKSTKIFESIVQEVTKGNIND